MADCNGRKGGLDVLRSNSGSARSIVILLVLAAAGYWYWTHYGPAAEPGNQGNPAATQAPASPQASAPDKQEPVYDNAQEYARKNVSFAGIIGEARLERPGLVLKFENRGEKDVSNLSVQIIGYREPHVMDLSKANGTEYVVDLEVKSFPAKKVTETVLYFPAGVLSINPGITVYNASF